MTDDYGKTRRLALQRRYRKQRRLRILNGEPTSLVPADAAHAHAARLLDLGWSAQALEQWVHGRISSTTIQAVADARNPMVERATERAILSIPWTAAPPPWMDDRTFVPVLGARRRVEALLRGGWQHRVLAAEYGAETGHVTRGSHPQMVASKWRQIDALFEQLCMVPGPSELSKTRAAKAGLRPALAWVNIDDPDEDPTGWEYTPPTRAEILEEVDARGGGLSEALRLTKTSRSALEKWCERNGHNRLFARLRARENADYERYARPREEAS